MSVYVYSTLTGSQKYPTWKKTSNDLPLMESYVLIRGGANLAEKHLHTPKGVVTEISDEEYERVRNTSGFKLHFDGGFLKVEKREHSLESVVGDMESRDGGAPKTPEDFRPGTEPTTANTESPDVQSEIREAQAPISQGAPPTAADLGTETEATADAGAETEATADAGAEQAPTRQRQPRGASA